MATAEVTVPSVVVATATAQAMAAVEDTTATATASARALAGSGPKAERSAEVANRQPMHLRLGLRMQ